MSDTIIAEPCNYCENTAVDYVDVPVVSKDSMGPEMKRVFFCAYHWKIWAERATKFAKASRLAFKGGDRLEPIRTPAPEPEPKPGRVQRFLASLPEVDWS